jgi:putative ABC transport system ATP-binding protein
MIKLIDIRKVFNAGKPNELIAVDGVSLAIEAHQLTALKGPSGSGKTTLLSMVGCMTRPTAGRIILDDREITSLPERFLTAIRRRDFGFIFQQFNLLKGISVLENIMLPAYPNGGNHGAVRERAQGLLAMFNLSDKAEARVEWLSGGEAQRVAIARALVNNPRVIIADEPTAHLDSRLSLEFMEYMKNFKAQGKTVIIASHDPIVFESEAVDRVVEMRDGRLVSSGQLLMRPRLIRGR